MVNLLVVALLLVTSNANQVGIGPFQYLCKKQDGNYISFKDTVGIMRVNVGNGNGKNIGYFNTESDGTIAAQSRNIGDGLMEPVELWLMVECATYRNYCPAVENMCQFTTQSHITIVTPYTGYEKFYHNGFFALITPAQQMIVKSFSDLPQGKMTLAEVCEPPHGISEVNECNYKQLTKRSSNTDNDVATADFDKVVINDFHFYCKKQDGSHIPLDNTNIVVYGPTSGFLSTSKDLGRFNTTFTGRLNIETLRFDKGDPIEIRVNLLCAAEYRLQCPGVNNLCNSIGNPHHYTTAIPYQSNRAAFATKDAVWSLTSGLSSAVVENVAYLDTTPMTKAEFCAYPENPQIYSCDWSGSESNNNQNIDKHAATADFNKGRPTRLANGIF